MAGAYPTPHEHAALRGSLGETGYTRRRPELSVLHRVVRENLETFLADARQRLGTGYPRFVENEFRRYRIVMRRLGTRWVMTDLVMTWIS